MSHKIIREIMADIKEAVQYSVMADETADKSNTGQLVICVTWVDDNLEAHEQFIGLLPLKGTSADDVFPIIKDVLLHLNLNISDARGQCYDGARAMMGKQSGVATKFKEINFKMLTVHCYGHDLNLAVDDFVKNVQPMKNTLDTTKEICDFVKKSPNRNTKLDDIRDKSGIAYKIIHSMCPTRWTIKDDTQ